MNVVVFEDGIDRHENIRLLLPLIFNDPNLNIQIFTSWDDFLLRYKNIGEVNYLFLDNQLEESEINGHLEEFNGDKVSGIIKVIPEFSEAKIIGISTDQYYYIDAWMGKFPRERDGSFIPELMAEMLRENIEEQGVNLLPQKETETSSFH